MASTFPLKGSQLGSAHAPLPRPSQVARMGLPYPDAAQPGLQASGVTLTWTRSSGHSKHSVCGTPPCPCSGGPLPDTFPPAPQVKFYYPLRPCFSVTSLLLSLTRPPLHSRMNTLLPLLCFVVPVFLSTHSRHTCLCRSTVGWAVP